MVEYSKDNTLWMGRNGPDLAAITVREDGVLVFSSTCLRTPEQMVKTSYPVTPANSEAIFWASEAFVFGIQAEVPPPDYGGTDFDFTEEEFRERLAACQPFVDGDVVLLDTSEVFMRGGGDEESEHYCLVRRTDDGVVVRIYEPTVGYGTNWPDERAFERFSVPAELREKFRQQAEKLTARERELKAARRAEVIAHLHELGIRFSE